MQFLGLGQQQDVHPPVTQLSYGQPSKPAIQARPSRRTVADRHVLHSFHAGMDMVTIGCWLGDDRIAFRIDHHARGKRQEVEFLACPVTRLTAGCATCAQGLHAPELKLDLGTLCGPERLYGSIPKVLLP